MAKPCKYGKLKNPIGRRRCKKKPKGASALARKGKQCKKIALACRTVRPGLPKICTVKITGEPDRLMSSTKAGPFVSKVYNALKRRGCHPKVSREGA